MTTKLHVFDHVDHAFDYVRILDGCQAVVLRHDLPPFSPAQRRADGKAQLGRHHLTAGAGAVLVDDGGKLADAVRRPNRTAASRYAGRRGASGSAGRRGTSGSAPGSSKRAVS